MDDAALSRAFTVLKGMTRNNHGGMGDRVKQAVISKGLIDEEEDKLSSAREKEMNFQSVSECQPLAWCSILVLKVGSGGRLRCIGLAVWVMIRGVG